MELPKLSDSQKKIFKSALIALVIIIILLALGLLFSKQKDQILSGVLDSQNKTSAPASTLVTTNPDGTTTTTVIGAEGANATGATNSTSTSTTIIGADGKAVTTTTNKPASSKGVINFLKNFFAGKAIDSVSGNSSVNAPILDSIQKELDVYKDAVPKGAGANQYGLASDDPGFVKQLQEAHNQYSKLEEQLHTATMQLQQTQTQMNAYQATGGAQSGTLFQATAGTVQNQITQYQGQVLDMQVQTTFAAIEMAYYFCQGITPGANAGTPQLISLDDITNGNVQLFSDDGSFNYQVCGSLISWIHTLPTWLQAQGPSLQLTNYLPYLQQIIQSAAFYYCPTLPQSQVPPAGQITLGSILNQLTNYTPPSCPTNQGATTQYTNTGIQTTAAGIQTTATTQYATQSPQYGGVTLAITSIAPDPVLNAVPVTISWYSTGVDPNTCSIIDITNDPTNFASGTVIATGKPALGSFQFTPIQSIGEHIIGISCTATVNGASVSVTDKDKFTIAQSTTNPYIALAVSSSSIVTGDPSPTLTWISQGIASKKCSLYKNGTKVMENLPENATKYGLPIDTTVGTIYYQLMCQSQQNTLVPSNPVMYTVTQPGAVTVNLKANGQDTLSFNTPNQQLNFTWTQTGTINSCTGNFAPGVTLPASYSGSNYSKLVTSSQYFTISCVGPGNQKASDMVLVQKVPAAAPLPITVDLKFNNQDAVVQPTAVALNGSFTWSSTGPVTTCTSNFSTATLDPQYSGSAYSKTVEKGSYFTISCTGAAGQKATDTVLITMGQDFASQAQYQNANFTSNNLAAFVANRLVIADPIKFPTVTNKIARNLGIALGTYVTGINPQNQTASLVGSVKRNKATSAQIQLQILNAAKQIVWSSSIYNYSGSTITNKPDDVLPFVYQNIPAQNLANNLIIKDLVSQQTLFGPITLRELGLREFGTSNTAQNYVFINKFNILAPPWIGIFDVVNANLKKVLVGMLVYTELYIIPIIKNFPPTAWQGRSDLNVTIDPQKSYVEEGEMFVTGRIAAQRYEVKNLNMQVRYGTIPGITTKLQAQNLGGNTTVGMFKKASLQTAPVEFYRTDPQTNLVITSTSVNLDPNTSVTFGAHIHNLDKDKPYFFDVVDATTLVPVLKILN